jgi:hypothetical protein
MLAGYNLLTNKKLLPPAPGPQQTKRQAKPVFAKISNFPDRWRAHGLERSKVILAIRFSCVLCQVRVPPALP